MKRPAREGLRCTGTTRVAKPSSKSQSSSPAGGAPLYAANLIAALAATDLGIKALAESGDLNDYIFSLARLFIVNEVRI
jgi:hypothetical protein